MKDISKICLVKPRTQGKLRKSNLMYRGFLARCLLGVEDQYHQLSELLAPDQGKNSHRLVEVFHDRIRKAAAQVMRGQGVEAGRAISIAIMEPVGMGTLADLLTMMTLVVQKVVPECQMEKMEALGDLSIVTQGEVATVIVMVAVVMAIALGFATKVRADTGINAALIIHHLVEVGETVDRGVTVVVMVAVLAGVMIETMIEGIRGEQEAGNMIQDIEMVVGVDLILRLTTESMDLIGMGRHLIVMEAVATADIGVMIEGA